MRNLESLIAEFVDGLLLAIGDASVEELRELLAHTDAGEPLYAPKAEPEAVAAPPARRGRLARLDHSTELRRSIEASLSSAASAAHAAVAEITDPESLLSLGEPNGGSSSFFETFRHAPAVVRPAPPPPISVALLEHPTRSNGHAESETDSPASGVRPRWGGSTVRLSDNETFARVSNSGVVIRRKKKA
jgi:hypothetical protein